MNISFAQTMALAISFSFPLPIGIVQNANESGHQNARRSTAASTVANSAMKGLVGKSIFTCYLYPQSSPMDAANPHFYDAKDDAGNTIHAYALMEYFRTGDKLRIEAAETDSALVPGRFSKVVAVDLLVENQRSKATAGVEIEVNQSQVTPQRILSAIVDNVAFSLRPVVDDSYPRIGMTRNDVICRLGVQDHTNHDELGGDELIFFGGKLHVYLSPRTDRVTNVQSSD